MLKNIVLAAVMVAPLLSAPGALAAPGPAQCPADFPVAQVKTGMKGYGLTVAQGTEPERFTWKAVDVLTDGIGPGHDLIIVETDSPAIDRAGGIWAGMSGSPLYTDDGRILGALSYGFAYGPSKLAGITPAADMRELLPARVKLPAAARQRVGAPAGGLSRLPTPLGVSGLGQDRIEKFNSQLARAGSDLRLTASAAAKGGLTTQKIVPGGNLAAALSYGDYTQAAIGTATMVCGDEVLGFGHPLQFSGKAALSAHSASAVTIVRDDVDGAYKLANIGDVVGTLTQDRSTGIVAKLGVRPDGTEVTATVRDGAKARTGTTVVNMATDLPLGAALHLLVDTDRVRDGVGGGSADLTWTATGLADGRPFTLTRTNLITSGLAERDLSGTMPYEMFSMLTGLYANKHADVKFTGVRAEANVSDRFGQYTLRSVAVKSGSKWRTLSADGTLSVRAGGTVQLRVKLDAFRGKARTVHLKTVIPKNRKGATGTLTVAGQNGAYALSADCLFLGAADCAEDVKADSFTRTIAKLNALPRNNDLLTTFAFDKTGRVKAGRVLTNTRLDQIVDGSFALTIAVR